MCSLPNTDRDTTLTRMFFSATKTVGVDTTAMLVSDVAPFRSCLAMKSAVSSEYCG